MTLYTPEKAAGFEPLIPCIVVTVVFLLQKRVISLLIMLQPSFAACLANSYLTFKTQLEEPFLTQYKTLLSTLMFLVQVVWFTKKQINKCPTI